MELSPVSSSNLCAVGYEGTTLVILFHNDRCYRYFGVPASKYSGLMSADSKGQYFAEYIRDIYPFERIS